MVCPLLPGHGTNLDFFERTTWRDWAATAAEAYERLGREAGDALGEPAERHLLVGGGLNILMLIIATAVMTWLLRFIIIKPLGEMRETMSQIEANADLRCRLADRSNDEIGGL